MYFTIRVRRNKVEKRGREERIIVRERRGIKNKKGRQQNRRKLWIKREAGGFSRMSSVNILPSFPWEPVSVILCPV